MAPSAGARRRRRRGVVTLALGTRSRGLASTRRVRSLRGPHVGQALRASTLMAVGDVFGRRDRSAVACSLTEMSTMSVGHGADVSPMSRGWPAKDVQGLYRTVTRESGGSVMLVVV